MITKNNPHNQIIYGKIVKMLTTEKFNGLPFSQTRR